MTTDIAAEVQQVRDEVASVEAVRLLSVERPPTTDTFRLTSRPLPETVALARELGASELYLFTDERDGAVVRAGVAFFHAGHVHTVHREADGDDSASVTLATGEGDETAGRDGTGVTDETAARKRELADELLSEYGEYLDEGDEFRLTRRLETTSVPQLLRMREEVHAEARADPEEEDRLAHVVFRDGRFNEAYTEADTEMLLNALNVDYDPECVRMSEVHQKAMSLLKIND
jgi:hypothetical protein